MSLRSHEAAACAVIAIGVCGVLVGSLLVESMRNGQSSAKATVSTAQSTEEGKSTGKRERDKEELDGGKPSIKGMLKRLGVESAATASPPQKDKDMEVAI